MFNFEQQKHEIYDMFDLACRLEPLYGRATHGCDKMIRTFTSRWSGWDKKSRSYHMIHSIIGEFPPRIGFTWVPSASLSAGVTADRRFEVAASFLKLFRADAESVSQKCVRSHVLPPNSRNAGVVAVLKRWSGLNHRSRRRNATMLAASP